MSLTIYEIKGMFTDTIFHRGKSYYDQGRVKDLAFDPVRLSWHAKVKGTKVYYVTVREDDCEFEVDCNCPVAGPCKHVVAVLLKIYKTESEISKKPDSSVSDRQRLIERQKQLEQESDRRLQDWRDNSRKDRKSM